MKKVLKIVGLILIVSITVLSYSCLSNMKDRHPDYSAELKLINPRATGLRTGFAAIPFTPEVPDKWEDKNEDYKYNPKDGDTYIDGNGNGKFDPIWIAGFSNSKPANGIHDDVWARTMIIDDGKTRLAIVILDAIGFMHDDIVDVRKMIPEEAGITYSVIASTHTHEGPDLLGLWGESPFKSGINKDYMNFVKNQIVESIVSASKNLRPSVLEISEDLEGAIPLVKDTREPEVFDSGIRIIKAVDKENGNTLGTLVSWADHPETLWSKNLLISSDFPHFVREGIEKGVYNGDSLVKQGTGAVCIYMNGAVGGLMTTHPSLPVKNPFTGIELNEPTYEKTKAQGLQLSMLALDAMEKPKEIIDTADISLLVRNIELPVENNLFKLATALGVLDRGMVSWMKMRSELAVFKIGPASFVTVPGEIYPEIINGGIDTPEGNDFALSAPVEIPSVREMMPGEYKFVIGLANDEIGYIIPKSQWDTKKPYTYVPDDSPYGEENSLGAETAPIIHKNLKEMLAELKP